MAAKFVDLKEISVEAERLLNWLITEHGLCTGVFIGIVVGLLLGWIFRGRFGAVRDENGEPVTYTMAGYGEYKMVLVVRQDLGMGKGKVAAQCAHAAVGLCRQMLQNNSKVLRLWENSAQPKVVVKAPDEDTLVSLAKKARSYGLETCLIRDAGRTQIAPGSKTVLGVGPGPLELVDKVTGSLKLY